MRPTGWLAGDRRKKRTKTAELQTGGQADECGEQTVDKSARRLDEY